MRKTKIVCTIGPACSDEATLTEMCRAGMNVARLNFSHGTHADHLDHIEKIKRIREKLNLPIAILLDTKGPEYRIRTFKDGKVMLHEGDTFTFTTDEGVIGDETRVAVSYAGLADDLEAGDLILLNNGLLAFRVDDVRGGEVITTVTTGGELSDRKSMSFPGKVLHQVYLSEQDKDDIRFGLENGVDFIACSSGIMIGRGDMGVEIPFEELPSIQKQLITSCRLLGKRVITATEMLESMIHNIRPTRAEISDVANAVYDGTSAVMLSGETAAGKYPVETVATMARIAKAAEEGIEYDRRYRTYEFKIKNTVDAISHGACGMAIDIGAKAIAVCSLSGMTARMVSRFRSPVDILGVTTSEKTFRKLALSWGVTPVLCEPLNSTDVLFYRAKQLAKEAFDLRCGDLIVVTGGITNGHSGNTDLIKVEKI